MRTFPFGAVKSVSVYISRGLDALVIQLAGGGGYVSRKRALAPYIGCGSEWPHIRGVASSA
jgi:hypothetical protein